MKIISSELYVKDNKVYHEGNKPKPKDIGAAPETHTHNYASATTPGGSAEHAIKATEDSLGQRIDTYIKGLSVSGRTITYTRGDGTTGTITTQDTNTDTKVTNTLNTTAKAYITGTTDSATNTGTQVFDTNVYLDTTAGMLTATTFKGALQGNAATATSATSATSATKLATARTINGTSFDGTGNITTANWGAARNIQIGNSSKSVNGSSNMTWTLAEIGAAPDGHTHNYAATSHKHGLLHDNFGVTIENTTTDNGWSMINSSYNGFLLKSLRSSANAPAWLQGDYSAGIAFGGADTKGVMSVAYSRPSVRFAGGNGSKPVWHFTVNGSSGKTYNMDSLAANTANTLATTRTINGTSFNGSANITTANWGTARNIYVADADGTNTGAAVSVNGAGNATLKLPSTIKASLAGNASTASTLATARTIGKASFNGSANITLAQIMGYATTASSGNATYVNQWTKFATVDVSGGTYRECTGSFIFSSKEADAFSGTLQFYFRTGNTVASTGISLRWTELTSSSYANCVAAVKVSDGKYDLYFKPIANYTTMSITALVQQVGFLTLHSNQSYSSSITAAATSSLSACANTANTLATARTINGTSFNGSANITTANWGTARNIQIGNTAKSVNGSANVTWTLGEIGAAASNHTHSYLPLSGGTLTGNIKFSGGGYNNHAIRMEAGDANGAFIGIGAGGLTVIGSGESTNAVRTALTNGADETMIVASDQTIRFLTGMQNGYDSAKEVSINTSGVINAPQGMTGNASTATKLQTARTINGTSFDGSGNITTANWGTARNITIGNTAKSVNGSGNVAWSLSEIGAVDKTNGVANNITLGKYATFADYDDSSILKKSYLRSGIWTTEFTDMKISGNLVYHAGRKPTASEIGAAASNHTHNYLPLSGGTLTGSLKISGKNKDLVIGAGTGDVYINNTASGKYIQMKDDGLLSYSGNKIYHAGDKPTASEVGALATSGGTMSGNLTLNNAKGIYGKTAEALTDSEGATVAAGATGTLLTYNGSHNFHLGALITDKKLTVGNTYLNAAHNMYLRNVTSDGAISLQVGGSTRMTVNSTATTVSKLVSNGGITTGGSIVSDTALTDNLGSSSIPFNVGYVKQLNLVGEASKGYGYLSAYTVGTTSTNGEARLVLGNSTASGTASNASGSLFLYGTGAGYTCIRPSNNTENKYTQYFPTGNGSIPLMNKADTNYWGMVNPDGSSSSWVRTTSSGIIPFDQSATSALGTSSWPFKCAYINEIFESGTSLKNKYLTKSGGTLTGNLTVQGQTTLGATVLNNNTSLYGCNKSGTKINICGIDTSNNIYLGWNNETYINVNNTMRTYRDLHVLNGAAMRVTGQTVLARTESYRQIAVVSTAGDGNGQGDGQTHLGYFDNGYHHYFRGSGAMHVDMLGGLKIGGKRLSIGSSAHSNPATGDVWIQV